MGPQQDRCRVTRIGVQLHAGPQDDLFRHAVRLAASKQHANRVVPNAVVTVVDGFLDRLRIVGHAVPHGPVIVHTSRAGR